MVLSLWAIRENDDDFDPLHGYGDEKDLFSLKINHGGFFTKFPGRTYTNGKVNYVDLLDADLFSAIELNEIIKELGYCKDDKMYYHYKVPETDLDFGLRACGNDKDVLCMLKYVGNHKLIEIYIEHWITKVDTYFKSPESKVVIEEIVDDVSENENVAKKDSRSKKSCKKQLLLEWQGNSSEMGQQDVEGMGQQDVEDIGQQIDLGTDVDEYRPVRVDRMDDLGDRNINVDGLDLGDISCGNDFNPFPDLPDVGERNVVNMFDEMEKNIVEDERSSEYDSDFMEDEHNLVDEVHVDMKTFHLNIDADVEWVGQNNDVNEVEEVDVEEEAIDLEDFNSDFECEDDGPRNVALKRLRKEQRKSNVDSTKTHFYVGQNFGSKEEIKNCIKMHAIETRRQLHTGRNDSIRVRVVCKGSIPVFEEGTSKDGSDKEGQQKGGSSKGTSALKTKTKSGPQLQKKGKDSCKADEKETNCPWVLHISRATVEATWTVKTYKNEHKCLQTRNVKQCTATFLSKDVEEIILPNPEIPIKSLQEQLQKKYELGVSHMKIFRAKVMASNKVMGDYSVQYRLLRDYCLEVKRTNPDTTIKIEVEREYNPSSPTRQFKRIYICLGALKKGFRLCQRDLLGLDGCFMKGPYPGQILSAVGIDGNNGTYPLAYAFVESENTNSWTWFLDCLGQDLGLEVNSNFTSISDRQKGVIPAISKLYPCAEHRYCLRHIYENMKLQWKGKLYKDMLWKCATATTVQQFEKYMEELKKINLSAYEWLKEIPPMHWSRSHFKGRSHCDVLLNNMCEVFNRQLVNGRDKPIITCLEFIREYLMKRIVNVQKVIDSSDGPLTPTATKVFNSIKKEAAQYKVIWNGSHKYQVTGPWIEQFVVDVKEKECTCRKWELTGMPCKHAVATFWNMGLNNIEVGVPESWCHPVYWLSTWKSVYDCKIDPINGKDFWPKSECPTTLLPPNHHNQVGRPKKKRKKCADELSQSKLVDGGKLTRAGNNSRLCRGQGNASQVSQANASQS